MFKDLLSNAQKIATGTICLVEYEGETKNLNLAEINTIIMTQEIEKIIIQKKGDNIIEDKNGITINPTH